MILNASLPAYRRLPPPSKRRRVLARANRQQMAFERNEALRNDDRWGALLLDYVRQDSQEQREAWLAR